MTKIGQMCLFILMYSNIFLIFHEKPFILLLQNFGLKLCQCQYMGQTWTFKGTNVFPSDFQACHVYCAFILGYICRNTVNFETKEEGSILINILASNNCFSDRNIFQNGVDPLSKTDDAFSINSWTFPLQNIRLCSNFANFDINTNYGITNEISYFRCQHLQR